MGRRIIGAVALFLLAMAGVWAAIADAEIPADILEQTGLSEQTLLLLSMVNNALIVGVAVLIGAVTAHRVGLYSIVAHPADNLGRKLSALPIYLVLGVLFGFAVAFADHWAFTHIEALRAVEEGNGAALDGASPSLAVRFLYGGITEEVLLRWGMLSFFAWIIWAMTKSRGAALWVTIPVTALLFGAGHLPAVYAMLDTVPMEMVIRVIALNAVLGVAYGIIYARNSLEAGMVAHAATHVGMLMAAQYVLT